MQEIPFTPSNYQKLFKDERSTIRLGERSYYKGEVLLTCRSLELSFISTIREVEITTFGKLDDIHAAMEGFSNLSELKEELRLLYRTEITSADTVTIAYFGES
ncbi:MULTISPECIES: ASCH domain-containing protein [Vibrio]|uniref:ASCH domain-containing protein n=1 Tax=Vibrio TaxID=662 RepID=UPI002074C0EA|nr:MULTISPECIES: ASCH domain-containing protein [Vibrio]USD35571.1 hypothetical protein J8Z27_22425 [Vibrio sp. SCSIO 43186]USD72695.1 hypothetical protein J4N41_22440 [Vibrio sp. SCSIO 43139]USD98910.1 hypothetical protein CTT30_22775 [Vibrio coralliilyticus]